MVGTRDFGKKTNGRYRNESPRKAPSGKQTTTTSPRVRTKQDPSNPGLTEGPVPSPIDWGTGCIAKGPLHNPRPIPAASKGPLGAKTRSATIDGFGREEHCSRGQRDLPEPTVPQKGIPYFPVAVLRKTPIRLPHGSPKRDRRRSPLVSAEGERTDLARPIGRAPTLDDGGGDSTRASPPNPASFR